MVAALEGPDAREGGRVNPLRPFGVGGRWMIWRARFIRRFHPARRHFTVGPCAGPHHAI